MKRSDFIHQIIRYVLLLALAMIAIVLGRKVNVSDCSGCPEIAYCPKNIDCNKQTR